MLGKVEGMRRKVVTEDKMAGWYVINGHEFESSGRQ